MLCALTSLGFSNLCDALSLSLSLSLSLALALSLCLITSCLSFSLPVDWAKDVTPEHRSEPRRAIFNHVCKELVPADVLSRYAKTLHPDFTALWLFRRQFTSQIALWALMTYVLGLNKPLPHALKIVATSGHVLFWELAFSMDGNGLLTLNDRLPFRLTSSLQHFITPVGLSGIFSGCFLAGAQALADPEQWLSDHAGIIVRDEMVSWAGMALPRGLEPDSLAQRLRTNLENIQRRVANIAGPDGGQPLLDALVKGATNPALLCLNPPTWHPWL
jgi:transformation/transcription domain-associated protein